jgi:hypothetical protein
MQNCLAVCISDVHQQAEPFYVQRVAHKKKGRRGIQ